MAPRTRPQMAPAGPPNNASCAQLLVNPAPLSLRPNLRTKILDFRGFYSSRILISRGGIPRDVPEILSERILVGIILVRSVRPGHRPDASRRHRPETEAFFRHARFRFTGPEHRLMSRGGSRRCQNHPCATGNEKKAWHAPCFSRCR